MPSRLLTERKDLTVLRAIAWIVAFLVVIAIWAWAANELSIHLQK